MENDRIEIVEAELHEIRSKLEEVRNGVQDIADDELAELTGKMEKLEEERNAILAKAEEDREQRERIASGEDVAKIIEKKEDNEMSEVRFTRDSKEYRDAFSAYLKGSMTAEQRGMFADNSAYGDGVSLPIGLDEKIWDQVHTAHPILADVAVRNSGIAIKVTKVTPGAATKGKDSGTKNEQTATGVDVVLYGADYSAKLKVSLAEAKMSQGAMEDFLAEEVAAAVGEALAKDIFARILSDATTAQKVTETTSVYADIASALGKAKYANNPVIYANAEDYYKILGAVDTVGQPIVRNGVALNAELKKDNAATKITVVDPKMFCLNVIQETTVKAFEDEDFNRTISAILRAEGCLRNTKAAAYISAT